MGRHRLEFLTTPTGLLLLGLLVREAFSFWTGHPYDFELWIRNGYFVSQGANPYSAFLPPVTGLSFSYLNEKLPGVGYLPAWPLVVAGLYRLYSVLPGTNRFVLYFLIKQPSILGDVVLGFLVFRAIARWGGDRRTATLGLRFWMTFPYPILISAVWGQFDGIVAALFFAFLLSTRRARGYVSLGLGILLKWLPLIYVPLYAIRERGPRRLLVAFAVLVPLLLTVSIMGLMGWAYLGITAMSQSASHGGGGGLTYVNILQAPALAPLFASLGGFYFLMGYLWVPATALAGFVARRRFSEPSPENVVQSLLLVTTVFFLTRWGVYEQYLVYLLPLFYIDLVIWHPGRRSLWVITWILGLTYLLVNNDLLVRFFGPIDSRAVDVAYAFDQSDLGSIRVWALYVIEALFTIHLVQLVCTFFNPVRDTRPWLIRPFMRLPFISRRILPDVPGDP